MISSINSPIKDLSGPSTGKKSVMIIEPSIVIPEENDEIITSSY